MTSLGPNFARLWAAQATSAVGSRITRTALEMLAIVMLEPTTLELGLLAALSTAPGAIVGLLAGGVIDRSSKRRVLIGADIVRLLLLVSVPVAAWAGLLTIGQLFLVSALAGAATIVFQIADNTFLPVLVEREQLITANVRLEATEAGAEIAGPGLAGVLVELITAPVTILIDALSYAASALFLAGIRVEEPAAERLEPSGRRRPMRTLVRDVATGARSVWRVPILRSTLVANATMAFFGGFFATLYQVFALDTLRLSEGVVGVVISVGGVGALIGTGLAARISSKRRAAPILAALLVLSLGAGLAVPAAQGPAVLAVGLLVFHQLFGDTFAVAYQIFAVSLRQTLIPNSELGRASAFLHMTTSLLLAAGALVSGALGDAIGVRETLWIGAIGMLAAPLALAPRALRSRLRLDASPVTIGDDQNEGDRPQR